MNQLSYGTGGPSSEIVGLARTLSQSFWFPQLHVVHSSWDWYCPLDLCLETMSPRFWHFTSWSSQCRGPPVARPWCRKVWPCWTKRAPLMRIMSAVSSLTWSGNYCSLITLAIRCSFLVLRLPVASVLAEMCRCFSGWEDHKMYTCA